MQFQDGGLKLVTVFISPPEERLLAMAVNLWLLLLSDLVETIIPAITSSAEHLLSEIFETSTDRVAFVSLVVILKDTRLEEGVDTEVDIGTCCLLALSLVESLIHFLLSLLGSFVIEHLTVFQIVLQQEW